MKNKPDPDKYFELQRWKDFLRDIEPYLLEPWLLEIIRRVNEKRDETHN